MISRPTFIAGAASAVIGGALLYGLVWSGSLTAQAVVDPEEPAVPVAPEVEAFLSRPLADVIHESAGPSTAVTIAHDGTEPLTEVFVSLEITSSPLTNADAVDEFVTDPTVVDAREVQRRPEPVPEDDQDEPDEAESVGAEVEPGSTLSLSLAPDADELGLADEPGVYGLLVWLEVAGTRTLVAAQPTTWWTSSMSPLSVSVLTLVTDAADVSDPLVSHDHVAVAVDPTVLSNTVVIDAGLRDRDVVALVPGNPDISSLAHANDDSILAAALSQPSGASLLPWSSMEWVAVPSVLDGLTLAAVANAGAAAALAMPEAVGSDLFDAMEGRNPAMSVPEYAPELPVLVPHDALSRSIARRDLDPGAASAVTVAHAAVATLHESSTSVLIVPDGGVGNVEAVESLLAAPWVRAVEFEDVLSGSRPVVDVPEAGDNSAGLESARVDELANRLDRLSVLAETTTAPDLTMQEWGAGIVAGVQADHRGFTAAQDATARSAVDSADATLQAVRIADSSTLNLLADSGDIPVTIVNGLDRDVTVSVDLRSTSANLVVGDLPSATVPAGQELMVPVPVDAVSSADVLVTVTVRNSDGEAVSPTQTFSVRVRADWGNAATAIFSVLLVAILIAGVVRTVRRGRRDTRVDPAELSETELSDVDDTSGGGDD